MSRFTIKTWVGNRTLFEMDADILKEAIEMAIADKVDLIGADLINEDLHNADLSYADLTSVDLHSADLHKADLTNTDLTDANLYGANLTNAILTGTNLHNASLINTKLKGSIMDDDTVLDTGETWRKYLDEDTVIDTGETWRKYLDEVVPALLTSGGKSLKEVLSTGCWECHEWQNCPMHVVFGISTADEAPPLWRQRVHQFVLFFDAGLIPMPKLSE